MISVTSRLKMASFARRSAVPLPGPETAVFDC
jgi:hypothetical protein